MAYLSDDITDPSVYSDYPDVLRLETTNKVYGGKYTDGEDDKGISNLQAMQLMERDNYILNRVGEASVAPVGDVPGKPGIASLDTTGKVPDGQIPAAVTRNTSVQTLTNKTIAYADNTLTGVQATITGGATSIVSSDLTASKVLVSDADGKVDTSSVDASKIVSTDGTQTLTNKTIAYADNTLTGVQPIVDYSTSEVDTRQKWIDGKSIYKKTVPCSYSTTSGATKNNPHGISNMATCVKVEGMALQAGTYWQPIVAAFSSAYNQVTVTASDVIVSTTITQLLGADVNVTLYYTKTTD